MKTIQGSMQRKRGAAIVEFALILPLFLVLFLGTMEMTWFFHTRQTLVMIMRDGARRVSRGADPNDVKNYMEQRAQEFGINTLGANFHATVTTLGGEQVAIAGIELPFANVLIFGDIINFFGEFVFVDPNWEFQKYTVMRVSVTMLMEP